MHATTDTIAFLLFFSLCAWFFGVFLILDSLHNIIRNTTRRGD